MQRPQLEKKALAKLPENRWKKLLVEGARLQDTAIHDPNNLFNDIWVEIGPGYRYGEFKGYAFGHWDLVQTAMDALPYAPEYARLQIEHYFSLIYPDGMMPGTVSSKTRGSADLLRSETPLPCSHPPLWQEFVSDYHALTKDIEFLRIAFDFARKNLQWWQRERSAPEGGYYYLDVVKRWWESGVDAGVRWDEIDGKPHTCIDATCHIHSMIRRMGEWASILGEDAEAYTRQAAELGTFINAELWDDETKFFYDIEMVRGDKKKIKSYEGFWPLALGMADKGKQKALINHLMNPKEFFCHHPVATVAMDEEEYSKNCWRGPAWNGTNLWIIRGCRTQGFGKEANTLAEKVLDATLTRLEKYGTIFEFYNSADESMEGMSRKAEKRGPCRDYLGHNPLNAIFWTLDP